MGATLGTGPGEGAGVFLLADAFFFLLRGGILVGGRLDSKS